MRNNDNSRNNIDTLTAKLQQLEIQQTIITEEINEIRANIKKQTGKPVSGGVKIGTRVLLTTTGKFKCTTGTVTRIGKLISVRLDTGRITTRKRENIRILTDTQDEQYQRKQRDRES